MKGKELREVGRVDYFGSVIVKMDSKAIKRGKRNDCHED